MTTNKYTRKDHVIARYRRKFGGGWEDSPHSFLQVWGMIPTWQPGIRTNCHYTRNECEHYINRVTDPDDPWYLANGKHEWHVIGYIVPIREETRS